MASCLAAVILAAAAGAGVVVLLPRGWIYTFRSRARAVGTARERTAHAAAKWTGKVTLKKAK